MKRILMLNYEFPPLGGGGGVFSLKLAKGYINAGYEVDYITSRFKELKKKEIVEGINIYRVPAITRQNLQTANFPSMLSYVFFGVIIGIRLCFQNKYSFIHTIFVIPSGPVGLILSKLFKIPNLLTLVGGDVYDPSKKTSPHRKWYWRKTVTFIINQADRLTSISEDVKNNTVKYYSIKANIESIGLPYEKIKFTPATRKELGLEENKFYIVSVGRLVKRKGYSYLLEAISKLANPNVQCLLIGDGPEKENLLQLAKRLNIADRIKFLGYLPNEETKFQYLAIADLYVLSSIHEGFGIVLQEAMQVGLPIVSTNVGGQTDIVYEGHNGLLISPLNSIQLAQAVWKLYQDKQLRVQISNNNLHDLSKYALGVITQQYLAVINGT